jgi:hypothetical protein
MVLWTIAAGIQSRALAHGVEKDGLQQREIEDQAGMEAANIHCRGTAPVY